MRDFHCPNCGQRLAFENSACLSCGSALGFSVEQMALLVIATGEGGERAGAVDAEAYQLCANLHVGKCNWIVPKNNDGLMCASCAHTHHGRGHRVIQGTMDTNVREHRRARHAVG